MTLNSRHCLSSSSFRALNAAKAADSSDVDADESGEDVGVAAARSLTEEEAEEAGLVAARDAFREAISSRCRSESSSSSPIRSCASRSCSCSFKAARAKQIYLSRYCATEHMEESLTKGMSVSLTSFLTGLTGLGPSSSF